MTDLIKSYNPLAPYLLMPYLFLRFGMYDLLSLAKGVKEVNEIKLDKRAQRALGYLSGIPPTEEEILTQDVDLSEEENKEFEHLLSAWLSLQEIEIKEIGRTLLEVIQRLKLGAKGIRGRIESQEYLGLVRKSFRNWAAAESEERRVLVRNLLVNAASRSTSPDNILSMFIEWIDDYSDEHFRVIREISEASPGGLTRRELWEKFNPGREIPAEDSAEADMFKMLILDLTTGYVIRQPREKDFYGYYVRARSTPRSSGSLEIVQRTTAFDNNKKYVLTELGKQFVQYTMEETQPEGEGSVEVLPEEM